MNVPEMVKQLRSKKRILANARDGEKIHIGYRQKAVSLKELPHFASL